MIIVEEKRRRAKAAFGTDLPIRKKRPEYGDARYDDAIEFLGLNDASALCDVHDPLIEIAAELQFARRLEARAPSRPDAHHTLRAIIVMVEDILVAIGNLSEASIINIEKEFDQSCLCYGGSHVLAINRVANILHELSSAAWVASRVGSAPPSVTFEQDRAFEKLHKLSSGAALRLSALPLQVGMSFVELEQYAPLIPAEREFASANDFVVTMLRRLSVFAKAAFRVASKESGPRKDMAQFRAVHRLVQIYEHYVGPVSHTSTAGRSYLGEPQTGFGKFVEAFMVVADPDRLNRRGISNAIKQFAWPSRQKAKDGDALTTQMQRNKMIQEILNELGVVTN